MCRQVCRKDVMERSEKTKRTGCGWCPDSVLALCEYRRKPVENILGWGSTPSGTLRFKKIDGSFWNGETFRFADYTYMASLTVVL